MTITVSARATGMLERSRDALERSAAHPLLESMAAGTIDDAVFARYLGIEGAFVLTAARGVALCLAAEREEETMRELARILDELLGAQRRYFLRYGDGIDGRRNPLQECVEDAIVRADAATVTVLLAAAETLYETWAVRTLARDAQRIPPVQEWIDLHTAASFRAGAAFWRSAVDRIALERMNDAALDDVFRAALAAEDAFHSLPLRKESWS